MARLTKVENLIKVGADGADLLYNKAYKLFINFYKDLKELKGDDNLDIINYLYCTNHKRETFDCIAQKLCMSLSRLESKRKDFQKLFLIEYEKVLEEPSKVA